MSHNPAIHALDYTEPPKALDRRFVTGSLMLVMVLASMEQTVTSTAMPSIIGDLHGFEHYAWVTSIYLLASTVVVPLYGRLADAWGRKRVILGAIVIFSAASLLASTARSMPQLILWRALQGVGAGGIMPVVLTILGDIFTLEERGKIQGLFSFIWGSAAICGPLLGAFLVSTLGWRSIFFVNLPFAALGMAVLSLKYHDQEKPHSTDLDLPGVALVSLSCTCLLVVVSMFGGEAFSWTWGGALLAVSIVTGALFVRHERRAANPIMPPALMVNRNIGPSLLAGMLLGVGFFGVDTYVPLYVQGGLGGGVKAAAGVVTPVMFTWAASGVVAAPLIVRLGFRTMATIGSCVIATSFAALVACAYFGAPAWAFTAVLAVTGCGLGPASMSYLLAAQHSVAWQQRGIVTGAIQFFRTAGGAVGIGLLGAMFNLLLRPHARAFQAAGINPRALLDPDSRKQLTPEAVHSIGSVICHGLLWVFAAMALLGVAQVAVTLLMAGRGAQGEHVSAREAMESMAG